MPHRLPSSSPRGSLAARLLGALIAGLALWLAFPDHNLWWLAPLAPALFAPTVVGVRTRTGALLGFVFGMAFFVPTLSWSGVYVGALPWIALAVLQSLYFAAMGAALAAVQRRTVAPFLGACAWMTQEWLRSTTPFGGFPWVRLAFSQADAPWAPIVAWTSAPGLTFLLALAGGTLAAWVVALVSRQRPDESGSHEPATSGSASRVPAVRIPASFIPATVIAALGLLIGTLITPPTAGKPLKVAGVQGNVPTAGLDFNAQRRAVLDNHVKATLGLASRINAGSEPRPDVVVWPENSSDIDPKRNPDAAAEIQQSTDAVKVPLVVGAVLQEPAPKVSNSSMLYLPGKGLTDSYVKQHPVPFGEYIPYRSFFRMFSKQVDLVRADFVQGKKVGLFSLPTPAGTVKAAPIICFEVAYDDLIRKPVDRGAQILFVQTNNATFGYTAESTQQLATSRIRALEYGRSIVHISTVGVSALITPDGAAHDRSTLFTQKVLTGELPLRSQLTLADRMGRTPEIIGALVLAGALVLSLRRRRASRRESA